MIRPSLLADRPYWDAALETQSRAQWDALKLSGVVSENGK